MARGHRGEVDGVRFEGEAAPAPGVLQALARTDAIVIAPSNPYVSVWPILAVAGVRDALAARTVPCIAVSPLVGGRAVEVRQTMLARMAGGDTGARRGVLRGADRRARRRRVGPGGRAPPCGRSAAKDASS